MEHSKAKGPIDYRLKVLPARERPTENISSPSSVPKLRLLDQIHQAIRTRHYSPKTEETYVGWIKRFIFFHDKRHPAEMGEAEIGRFLSSLATDAKVSASTQNQAFNALLFLPGSPAEKDCSDRRSRSRQKTQALTGCPYKRRSRAASGLSRGCSVVNVDASVRCWAAAHGVLPLESQRYRLQ